MKNKKSIIAILLVLVIFATAITASAAGISLKITVVSNGATLKVNGKTVSADNFNYNGTLYVPLRAVAEILGLNVSWDDSTKTAHLNSKDYVAPASQQWVLKSSKFVPIVTNNNSQYIHTASSPAVENIHIKTTNSPSNDDPIVYEASYTWNPAPSILKPETDYTFSMKGVLMDYQDPKDAYAYPGSSMYIYWGYELEGETSMFPEKPRRSFMLTEDGNAYSTYATVEVNSNPNSTSPTARTVYMTTPKYDSRYYNSFYIVAYVQNWGYWKYEYTWVN